MRNIQVAANAKFAAQVRAQREHAERVRAARRREGEEHQRACRAVQWRTRFAAVERKLVEVKGYLRYSPQDPVLRREAETLEAMYKELLEEAGEPHDLVGSPA